MRHGHFGGAVHRDHEFVDALLLSGELEQLGGVVEQARQWNAHLRVVQKAADATEGLNRADGPAVDRRADTERPITLAETRRARRSLRTQTTHRAGACETR